MAADTEAAHPIEARVDAARVAVWHAVQGASGRVRALWRRSLHFRVISTTLLLSLVVVAALGQVLVSRVSSGLLNVSERTAIEEARAGLDEARALAVQTDTSDRRSAVLLVDKLAEQLTARAGQPSLYEVLLLGSGTGSDVPQRGSNLVSEASIPAELREAVESGPGQAWTYTSITYTDGRASVPGLVVGATLNVPGVGSYELYYLFPLDDEERTLSLLQRTLAFAGIFLVVLLGVIAWIVTRQVVDPVRQAAQTAERLSAGLLEERMDVEGEDDIARLGTSFNQMAASLQTQIRQLEDLSRVQRRFVSDVSHELRTPLTTVRMAADVLHEARDGFDPAVARSAELLQTQLDRFELLLTDLLEISRHDAGAAVLAAEPVDLSDLVSRVAMVAEPLARQRNSELVLTGTDHEWVAQLDTRRVERILRNLVLNAIEHGEGRPVELRVEGNEDAVAVTVRDHGQGLRPGEAALVFNRFWRADPARTRTLGGTGLGLSIALEDAHLHGGWLQAWGEPGDGANFRLTLPRRKDGEFAESPLPLRPPDARRDVPSAKPYGWRGDR